VEKSCVAKEKKEEMQRKNVVSLQLNMRFTQTCDVWKFAMLKNLYFHNCETYFFVPEPL